MQTSYVYKKKSLKLFFKRIFLLTVDFTLLIRLEHSVRVNFEDSSGLPSLGLLEKVSLALQQT